jgi:hypothetical protein
MDYQRIYNQIVNRAKTRKLEGYREKHHIIPKCMGGPNKKENLVELTAREHFLCHWILSRIYPTNNKIGYAFWMMCNMSNVAKEEYIISGRAYQEGRERYVRGISGEYNPNKKEENRLKISKTMVERGYRPPSPKGIKRTPEHQRNLANSLKGKTHSEERRLRNSNVHKGLQVGDKNGMYKEVDKKSFKKDVLDGMKIGELYLKYKVSQTALYGRLEEFFGTRYFRQIRKKNNNVN